MKNKGYSIKSYILTPKGLVESCLGKDWVWYRACNDCSFKTLTDARKFFQSARGYELRGSFIWIEGPRGGRHRLFGDL